MVNERRPALTETVYACLRVVSAWVYFQHGAEKVFGAFGGMDGQGATAHLPGLIGWAGVIEVGCGVLILLGLLTRGAAFLASGEMAAAYFIAHAPRGLVVTVLNHGELPALFAFLFLYFALVGGGKYSLDALIAGRRGAAVPAPASP